MHPSDFRRKVPRTAKEIAESEAMYDEVLAEALTKINKREDRAAAKLSALPPVGTPLRDALDSFAKLDKRRQFWKGRATAEKNKLDAIGFAIRGKPDLFNSLGGTTTVGAIEADRVAAAERAAACEEQLARIQETIDQLRAAP